MKNLQPLMLNFLLHMYLALSSSNFILSLLYGMECIRHFLVLNSESSWSLLSSAWSNLEFSCIRLHFPLNPSPLHNLHQYHLLSSKLSTNSQEIWYVFCWFIYKHKWNMFLTYLHYFLDLCRCPTQPSSRDHVTCHYPLNRPILQLSRKQVHDLLSWILSLASFRILFLFISGAHWDILVRVNLN